MKKDLVSSTKNTTSEIASLSVCTFSFTAKHQAGKLPKNMSKSTKSRLVILANLFSDLVSIK